MNSFKAAYWTALGVLAFGISSEYQAGNFEAIHKISDRADSLVCRIAARAEQTLAVARVLTERDALRSRTLVASTNMADLAWDRAELAREQALNHSELLRDTVSDQVLAQVRVIRTEAQTRRKEIRQIQARTRAQIRLARTAGRKVKVVCAETGQIAVDDAIASDEGPSDIEVQENF